MQEQEQTIRQSSPNPEQVLDAVFKHMDNSGEVFWVDTDCCKAVAVVYRELYGYDLMSGIVYKGKSSADKLVANNIYNRVLRTLVPQGFKIIDRETTGSIGLVKMSNSQVAVAICVKEGLWAVRHETGFCLLNCRAETVLYNYKDNNKCHRH